MKSITQSEDGMDQWNFVNSSAQYRENGAGHDSNEKINTFFKARFRPGTSVPCRSAQTDKSVNST